MNIIYRNYALDDIERIIQFWNENSGWETNMDKAEFDLRFHSSPFGEPILMLAVDDDRNEIVGLCCFLAASVTIKGKNVICYRPFGAILKETFREQFGISSLLTGNHPILKLFKFGSSIAKQMNASLIYLIPDPRWSKIASVMPFSIHRFPLWSYHLKEDNSHLVKSTISVKDMHSNDPDIDRLWQQSPKTSFCTLTKSIQFYQLKVNMRHGLYQLKGVYENDKLIGLFTFHFKPGEQQWIIGDLLTLDNDEKLIHTLKAACYAAQIEWTEKHAINKKPYKVALLATPIIEQKVKALGFFKDDYYFMLAVQLLDNINFSKADVAPEHWHISAND